MIVDGPDSTSERVLAIFVTDHDSERGQIESSVEVSHNWFIKLQPWIFNQLYKLYQDCSQLSAY